MLSRSYRGDVRFRLRAEQLASEEKEKMSVIKKHTNENGDLTGWSFYCPACKEVHAIPKEYTCTESPIGSLSFSPTIYINEGGKLCHSIIVNDRLTYCCDCDHDMVNMTVQIPEQP